MDKSSTVQMDQTKSSMDKVDDKSSSDEVGKSLMNASCSESDIKSLSGAKALEVPSSVRIKGLLSRVKEAMRKTALSLQEESGEVL